MTPAAKLIAACEGHIPTAQALALEQVLRQVAKLADGPELLAAEKNLLTNMQQQCQPDTLGAVQYLLDMRERTKRQVEGTVFS